MVVREHGVLVAGVRFPALRQTRQAGAAHPWGACLPRSQAKLVLLG